MTVTITQKELLQILNEKLNSKVAIEQVAIEVVTKKGLKDYIYLDAKSWFVGSFIKEQIKNKGE